MSHLPDWKNIQIEELALIIGRQLKKFEIEAILVGGACVSIYSNNIYMSGDLDFVSYENSKKIKLALEELGFILDTNKYYTHNECPLFLEFLNPPVAIGNEPITKFNDIKTPIGEIKLLTPSDCVKDRLAAYYHWNDRQSLDQAVLVAKNQSINIAKIKQWSEVEGYIEKFNDFQEALAAHA